MKIVFASALFVSAFVALGLTAGVAQAETAGSRVEVSHPWARASAGNAQAGAAYLTLLDQGGTPDRLTGASTPVAGMADVHETVNDNGIMRMRSAGPIALEPGKPVTLAPGGYHVMLMQLKHPLHQGDSFPLTLTFERSAPVTVQVPVQAAGATAAGK